MPPRILLAALVLMVAAPVHGDTLVLANGDTINGEIVSWAVDHVVIEHPQLGRLRLGLDQLEIDTGTPPNPGFFGTNFMRGWSRRLDSGLTGKDGTSESTVITGGLRLSYADDWTRWNVNGRSFYDRDEDGVSDNNARLDVRRDFLAPDRKLFWSLGSRYQFDETESWEHRATFSGGPGYHVVKTDSHGFDVILGPAYTREFGDVNDHLAEGSLVFDYEWTVSEKTSFKAFNNFFLALAPNGGDIRNLTRTEWSTRIAERPELSLIVGIENEYLTDPEDGDDEHYNLVYYVTVGIDF